MSTLNITRPTRPVVRTLLATSGPKSVNLSWAKTEIASDRYEIWRDLTLTGPGSATLIGETSDGSFIDADISANTPALYWVKIRDQFGATSGFSTRANGTQGVIFNTYKLALWNLADVALTLSIDNVRARVYYTPLGGSPTDTGLIAFTNNPTTLGFGDTSWTNPNNARVDDTSYATNVATGGGQYSDILMFALSDLGVPSTATITGLIIQVDGKTTSRTNTNLNAVITDSSLSFGADNQFADFASNNTDEAISLGSSTNTTIWELSVDEEPVTGVAGPAVSDGEVVTSYLSPTSVRLQGLNGGGYVTLVAFDTGGSSGYTSSSASNAEAYGLTGVTSISSGVSSSSDIMTSTGSRFGSLPAYATWYIIGQTGTIYADGTFSNIKLLISALTTWQFSGVAVSTSETVELKIRIRLRNTTDSTEVTREFSLFKQTGTQAYACQPHFSLAPSVIYPDESFTPMRLVPGKNFVLYLEAYKSRTSGSDTLSARCTQAELDYSYEI